MNQTRCMLALTMCVLLTSAVRICTAATFTCGTGDVACLSASITAANRTPEPDTIQLAGGTYTLTAVDNTTDGRNGLPSVTSPLTILGAGADTTTLERADSAPTFRLIHVAPSGNLTLHRLILRGGRTDGAGLFNDGGTVVITHSTFMHNNAALGGHSAVVSATTAGRWSSRTAPFAATGQSSAGAWRMCLERRHRAGR